MPNEFGGPSAVGYGTTPRLVPGPGEVLTRVAGAAFNPSDVGLRSGLLRGVPPVGPPFVLGADVSGTVESVGGGTAGFASGGRVIGRLDRGGAAAEYAVVAAPVSVPLAETAAGRHHKRSWSAGRGVSARDAAGPDR
ncbi:alcohol dehydrogenase catalytic domain-containing protein [Spirillospora sp. NPDC127200]